MAASPAIIAKARGSCRAVLAVIVGLVTVVGALMLTDSRATDEHP